MLDSQGCPPPTLHALINLYGVVPPDSHCGWLSRYDRGLLLGLTSSAFLICIGSTLLGKVRIQVAQLKRSSFEGRFFVVSTGNVVGGALCAGHPKKGGVKHKV